MAMLCSLLSVSRSAYYAWTKAALSQRVQDDVELKTVITTTFTENRAIYGTRRMKAALATQGYQASRRRIARLMKEARLYWVSLNKRHQSPTRFYILNRCREVIKLFLFSQLCKLASVVL